MTAKCAGSQEGIPTMRSPAIWKFVTISAALTGLGVVCAGTAMAGPPDFLFKDE